MSVYLSFLQDDTNLTLLEGYHVSSGKVGESILVFLALPGPQETMTWGHLGVVLAYPLTLGAAGG